MLAINEALSTAACLSPDPRLALLDERAYRQSQHDYREHNSQHCPTVDAAPRATYALHAFDQRHRKTYQPRRERDKDRS